MKSSDVNSLLASSLSRRNFLGGVGALGGMILVARYAPVSCAQTKYNNSPFSLGVASGDPLPGGIVLWTRLAPDPFNGGGMGQQDVPVRWQIASDANMKSIVQKGTAMATAALGHSVHVEVEGLQPARTYWYQFESAGALSPIGRTRTAPALGSHPEQLRFAFASCQNWPAGFYTAYRHMAKQDLDLVVHLGDYIYEGAIRNSDVRPDVVPSQARTEPMTLEEYRMRYSLYKLDPDLQAAHAAFPFIVTWDDHEVDNNYAANIDQDNTDPAQFLMRRAAAYQAYYEHMPLRRTSLPHGPDMMLYRRLTYGDLAQFNVLDTRQYRSDQVANRGRKTNGRTAANLDPARSLMGTAQRQWLFDGLDNSPAQWNIMAQQVIMAQFSRENANGADSFGMDSWDGYPAERTQLMNFLARRKPKNPVVLAGDSHTNLVGDLKTDFDRPESPIVGSEFAGTAITSGGMSPDQDAARQADVARQPHLKWFEGTKRGYVICTLDRKTWKSDFLQVGNVKKPDSPVKVGSSWVIEDGKLGVQRA